MGIYFTPVLHTVLQILTIMAIGFFLRRARILPESFFSTLSAFLVEVALPLYMFTKISSTDSSVLGSSLVMSGAALVYVSFGLFFGFIVFHFSSFHGVEKRAGIGLCSFGNSAFLPLTLMEIFPHTVPMIADSFGTTVPALYISSFVLAQSPLLWSVGYALITGSARGLRLSRVLNAPIVAIFLGFLSLITGFNTVLTNEHFFLYHVFEGAKMVGGTTLPLILISIGAMIATIETRVEGKKKLASMALRVAGVRFLIFPIIFFTSYFLFLKELDFLTPTHIWVLFLEAHLPPATNLALMANKSGVNEDYTAFTTLITYGGYLVVLPLYLSYFLSIL
jgi:predicted permease